MNRFAKDQFDDFRESTIGAAFLTQTIQLDQNTTVKFEIWYVNLRYKRPFTDPV